MRIIFAGLMLGLAVACVPSAQAQSPGVAYSVAPVAGIGMSSPLAYTGTGLSLGQPLSTTDLLSNEYGLTLPRHLNNNPIIEMRPIYSRATLGCFGTCFF